MDRKPDTLLIIGSGPIGCELGQAFQRLGVQVTMMERGTQFLPREDQDAAHLLFEQIESDGVNILFETAPIKFKLLSDDEHWSPDTLI